MVGLSRLPGKKEHRRRGHCRAAASSPSTSREREERKNLEGFDMEEVMEATKTDAMQELEVDIKSAPGLARTISLTIHGAHDAEDVARLERSLADVDGVQRVRVGEAELGGLRGGSVPVELQLEGRVSLKQVVESVHALEASLLALPFEARSWQWRGHNIRYAVAGQGTPVILVHGFGGNAGHFRNLIAHLADNHRVFAVDLLGFGDSDKPSDVAYGPELWADVINDFSAEFLDEPGVLIGNSIGSLTALTAAAKASRELYKGLVLLNCSGSMNRKGLAQDDLLLAALTPVFLVLEYLLKKPRIANYLFQGFRNKDNVKRILKQQVYRDKSAVTDQLIDILYKPSEDPGAVDVFIKVFLGDGGVRPEKLMEKIDLPLLVLWGDKDPWTPVNGRLAKYFKKLERERGNVRVEALRDVGHCPHDDRPELSAAHILPWLADLYGRR